MRKEKRKTNLGRPVRTESTANQSQQIVGRPNKDLGVGRWLLYTDQVGVKQLPCQIARSPTKQIYHRLGLIRQKKKELRPRPRPRLLLYPGRHLRTQVTNKSSPDS
jgi:hypothetical protein